jgi:hypothetical protein
MLAKKLGRPLDGEVRWNILRRLINQFKKLGNGSEMTSSQTAISFSTQVGVIRKERNLRVRGLSGRDVFHVLVLKAFDHPEWILL